jgi:hypothetical protein
MNFNRILFSVFLASMAFCLFGQNLETAPASTRWSQLKSQNFTVIFPKEQDSLAQYTAQKLEYNYAAVSSGLGVKPSRLSVILQNQDNASNGFVTYAPRRSEFFVSQPQDYSLSGNSNFIDLLAVHELRHVAQYAKANTGFNKIVKIVSGNFGLTALAHVSYPAWFWEGDATGTETALSQYGRGRIPSFTALQRAQLADNPRLYNYSAAVARSFTHNIPNHYVLGYYLTNYVKEKHGSQAWDKLLQKQNSLPPLPFGFSRQIKKLTGNSIDKLYGQVMKEAKSQLLSQIENRKLYSESYLKTSKSKYYTSYLYPQPMPDGSVLALKTGLSHIAHLVHIDSTGRERKLHNLGNYSDAAGLSANANKVTWAELIPDPRWQRRNYSVVKVLDLNTLKVSKIPGHTRLAAPAISASGQHIAAVHYLPSGMQSIRLVNIASGIVWHEVLGQAGQTFLQPTWLAADSQILYISLQNGQKTVQIYDIESNKSSLVFGPTNQNIAHARLFGSWLIYNNATNGTDNIFAFNTNTKQHHQLTHARHGAYSAMLNANHKYLYFNDFTANGHRIAKVPFLGSSNPAVALPQTTPAYVFANWIPQQPLIAPDTSLAKVSYPIRKYSKLAHLINIHSWGAFFGSDLSMASIGLQSQDILSTSSLSAGFGYNFQEKQSNYSASIQYEGLYPILSASFSLAGRHTILPAGTLKDQATALADSWLERNSSLGISLPLSFFNSAYFQKLNLSAKLNYTQGSDYDLPLRPTTQVGVSSLLSASYALSYSRSIKAAKRQVSPRWGQSIMFFSRNTLPGSKLQANQMAAQIGLTFPGIGPNSVLSLSANTLQNTAGSQYYFSSPVAWAWGHGYKIFHKLHTTTAAYRFLLADPNLTLTRILHVQRIKAGLLAQYSQGHITNNQNQKVTRTFSTVGFDLSAIFNLMRYNTSLEAGLRFSKLSGTGGLIVSPIVVDIPF